MKKILPVFGLVCWLAGCQFFSEKEPELDCNFPQQTDVPTGWLIDPIPMPPLAEYQNALFFLDEVTGFALNPLQKTIWKTQNAGINWTLFAELTQFPQLNRGSLRTAVFLDSQTGWILNDSLNCGAGNFVTCESHFRIFRISGGQVEPSPIADWQVGTLNNLHFLNEMVGFACKTTWNHADGSFTNSFQKTIDGGKTWQIIPEIVSPNERMQWLPDGKTGFVGGIGDRIYKTTDGGETWKFTSPGLPGLAEFIWTDAKTGFATHRNGLVYTTDGGDHWNHVGDQPMNLFCASADSVIGIAVFSCETADGNVFIDQSTRYFFTNDDGKNWGSSPVQNADFPRLVFQPKPGLAFVRGQFSTFRIRRQ